MIPKSKETSSPFVRIVRLICIFIFFLFLLEMVLRIFPEPSYLASTDKNAVTMKGSPTLLWEFIPGSRNAQGGDIYINSLGYRDIERSSKKNPRILAVGDSSIYGFGVSQAEVFSARLEKDNLYEVINAGVPGYSSEQAMKQIQESGLSLNPDLLIVATLWSDNNFSTFVDRERILQAEEKISTPMGFTAYQLSKLRIIQWLAISFYQKREYAREYIDGGHSYQKIGFRRVSVQHYAENLAYFCNLMRKRSGGVLFLTLASRLDIDASSLLSNTKISPIAMWSPYRAAMKETAEKCGAPHVSIVDVFKKSKKLANTLFLDEIHPSPLGHYYIAQAIESSLKTADWPQKAMMLNTISAVKANDPYEGRGVELGFVEKREVGPSGPPKDGKHGTIPNHPPSK